jgi:hypothetical protein
MRGQEITEDSTDPGGVLPAGCENDQTRLSEAIEDDIADAFGMSTLEVYLATLRDEGPAIMKRLRKPGEIYGNEK